MIAAIARLTGIPALAVWAIMIVLAGGAIWAWGNHQHRAGHNEGRSVERVVWEKAMQDMRAQMDAERRQAQAQIDKIEQDYLEGRKHDAVLIAALEAAIAQMESEDAEADNDTGPVCRPALPRGLSRQLDAIGR